MSIEDTYKIIMTLKAVYNTAFSKYTAKDFDNLASAWYMCLEDYPYEAVSIGVKAYMTTNTSQFPPVPSQIIDYIQKLNPQEQELNANEAWALVRKAVANSTYHAQYEFDRLPPMVQKAVGSPDNLREWAKDEDFNGGVEQSHFARVYNATVGREKEVAKLPMSVKQAIGMIAETQRKGIATNEQMRA